MGSRKELLRLPTANNNNNNKPLFIHLLQVLAESFPESDTLYMSLRDKTAMDKLCTDSRIIRVSENTLLMQVNERRRDLSVRVLFDFDTEDYYGCQKEDDDIGPAAGLMAAYREDPTANWVVVACDFPLLTPAVLWQLRGSFEGPVTCFVNKEGFFEPLLAIWTPEAFRRLEWNVNDGILGPSSVVRQLGGNGIRPDKEEWLFNANTKAEWGVALEMMNEL